MLFNCSIYILWSILVVVLCGYNLVNYKKKIFTWFSFLGFVPLLTVIVFSYVFIFNKGSNVAQLSGSHQLWSIWLNWWLPLLFFNLVNSLVAISILFVKKERINLNNESILKLLTVLTAIVSFYHVFVNMPDA